MIDFRFLVSSSDIKYGMENYEDHRKVVNNIISPHPYFSVTNSVASLSLIRRNVQSNWMQALFFPSNSGF